MDVHTGIEVLIWFAVVCLGEQVDFVAQPREPSTGFPAPGSDPAAIWRQLAADDRDPHFITLRFGRRLIFDWASSSSWASSWRERICSEIARIGYTTRPARMAGASPKVRAASTATPIPAVASAARRTRSKNGALKEPR